MLKCCRDRTNFHGNTLFCQREKKIQVKQPHMVKVYNEHMGGVDRMDQDVSKYRTEIQGKNGMPAL